MARPVPPPPTNPANRSRGYGRVLAAVVFAVAVVAAAYWPVLNVRSLVSDDVEYLVQNPLVRNPSWASAARFLREVRAPSTVAGHYQPLTMISLMLDAAVGGSPDKLLPFRRTNLLLHLANTALVVLLMHRLFGRPWCAAAVGLVFGLHPITVESVAWLSDRKTLLASFFGLAMVLVYTRYARTPRMRYLVAAFGLYVLALLSKASTIPLPFVCLLLDFWPLRRIGPRAAVEKIPFFLAAAVSAVITVQSHGSVASTRMPWEQAPMPLPLVICRNLLFYPLQFLLPVNVAPFHEFPQRPFTSDPLTVAGVVAVVVVPLVLLWSLRRTRALATGWLVHVVLLLPMIGIIGFMDVIAADRHLYLSMFGLLLVLAAIPDAFARPRAAGIAQIVPNPHDLAQAPVPGARPRGVIAVAAIAIVLVLESVATRRYLSIWRETESIHRYMVENAPRAPEAHYNLGIVLANQGKFGEAIESYSRAVELRPAYAPAHINLGTAYRQTAQGERALEHYREALRLEPDNAVVHNNLANLLVQSGSIEDRQKRVAEALDHYRAALRLSPGYVTAKIGLANLLADTGKPEEAIAQYSEALRANPGDGRIRINYAVCLVQLNRLDEALAEFDRLAAAQPGAAGIHYRRGMILEQMGRTDDAVAAYRRALALQPGAPPVQARLEALLARTAPRGEAPARSP